MNTTNMPGFAAEASLYQTSGHYQSVGTQASVASKSSAIVPQLRRLGAGSRGTLPLPSGRLVSYFSCGWNEKTLTSECTCSGDTDCNNMFNSGFCGGNASCDIDAGTCRCDLKL
jgi:hypothetical protein